jgi:hypothetical protein
MSITSRRPANMVGPKGRAYDFTEWRRAFHAQLERERVRFVTLSAALADVAAAAQASEQTSVPASSTRAENTDPAVWTAPAELVGIMGALDDTELSVKATVSG